MRKTEKKTGNSPDAGTMHLVEVVDALGRPLLVMPAESVHRQGLNHKIILVLLYDLQGRLYLQKRATSKTVYPGRWDLSATGHVQAGEAAMDAAVRELREELGVEPVSIKELCRVAACAETGHAFTTLFTTGRISAVPSPNPAEVAEGMFISADDLDATVTHFGEMLTPAVHWAYTNGFLFRRSA
jgi:isopentenyl-diphosphate delta-isomerase